MFMSEIFLQDSFANVTRDILLPKAYLESENASAVSLTLPLNEEAYSSKTLFSFFDGLIPEGWLLDVVSRNWKINNRDRFGLLLVACKDCIGNVTIMEEKL